MAVRTPLKYSGYQLQEIDDDEKESIVQLMLYQYFNSPSVTLSIVNHSGNLSSMSDTRMKAGAHSVSAGDSVPGITGADYPPQSSTDEPSVYALTYDKLSEVGSNSGNPTDTNNIKYPVYYDGNGNIQSMSRDDMYDTFCKSSGLGACEKLAEAKPYWVSDSTSPPSGYTNVSSECPCISGH